MKLDHVRVDQTTRFYRQGSVLGGSITSGSLGIDLTVEVQSPEPAERIAELVRIARSSCYTHGALGEPVTVETNVRLNGQPLQAAASSRG